MTKFLPDVSVVIPAFRAKDFVSFAIDSALSQCDVDVEVIVVDDASPDGTADFVNEQYAHDERVSVLKQSVNGGPSLARNAGLAAATANWVAILDADDTFEPGRLRRLLNSALAHNVDVIADNIRFYDATTGNLSEPRMALTEPVLKLTLHGFVARAHPGVDDLDLGLLKPMFNRAFLKRTSINYPVDIRHGEDFTLYFELLRAGACFIVIPVAGYRWALRTSGQSQTREDYPAQRREALRLAATVAEDVELVRLLRRRGSELLRWRYRRKLQEARINGGLQKRFSLAIRHPVYTFERYARSALRRLR